MYTVAPVSCPVADAGDDLEYCASFCTRLVSFCVNVWRSCSFSLCPAALCCANRHPTDPYCPVLPHITILSPTRPCTAHISHVVPRSLAIHACEEKGGKDGGGATRTWIWASVERFVGGAGAESGNGSVEHGGIIWDDDRRERTRPHWRQPATTSAEPRWLGEGVERRAYRDTCDVRGKISFRWCFSYLLMPVLFSVWWLPCFHSLVYCGRPVCSFSCSCWAQEERRRRRRGTGRAVFASGRKGVSDP